MQEQPSSGTVNVGNELAELNSKLRSKLVGKQVRIARSGNPQLPWGTTGKVLDLELGSFENGNVSLKLDSGTYVLKVVNFKSLVFEVLG